MIILKITINFQKESGYGYRIYKIYITEGDYIMEQRKPQNSGKKSFFDGAFGKYLVPGILLQSVLIGGGYATGREVISYGAMYGAKGWLAGLATLI